MKARRKIPYGIMNRAKVVRECHFADNTGYIRCLEWCKTPDLTGSVEIVIGEVNSHTGYHWLKVKGR